MKNLLTILVSIGFVLMSTGQITNAEYFIDIDPGAGLATPITLTSGNTIDENINIPTTSLSNGLHTLHVRTKGTANVWSLYKRSYFFINAPNNNLNPTNLVEAEYFIDNDPGAGLANTLAITSGMTLDEVFNIPTGSLANGLHVLHIRVKDADDTWSLYKRSYFFINAPNNNLNPTNLVEAEYFIDNDPGAGLANTLAITNGMTLDEVFNIPTGSLANGLHVLHIRVKDNDGTWSLYQRAYFFIHQSSNNTATPIINAEYFLDIDPGVGNGIPIAITAGFDVIEIFSAPIPLAFADGDHYIHVRVIDQDGTWSLYKRKLFVVDASVNDDLCSGVTRTWTGIWDDGFGDNSIPNVDDMVVINADYNTNIDGSFEACTCTINFGNTLTIYADQYVSLTNNLINDGKIDIKNNGSFVQFNENATVAGSGIYNVERITNDYVEFDFTYWSSPTTNEIISSVFAANDPNFIYDFTTANFADLFDGTYPQNSGTPDTFDDTNDDWNVVNSATVMTPGKGYIAQGPGSLPINQQTINFDKQFNTGTISVPVTLDANQIDNADNDNLIGNPYPSSIDAIAFMLKNPILSGTLYLWTHNTQLSGANPGPDALNFTNNDYSTWVAAGGVTANSGGQKPTDFIASCQGFFASVNGNGNVTFENSMRIKTNNDDFFRSPGPADQPDLQGNQVWFNMTNEDGIFRQILIGFYDEATNNHDRLFDGKRLFSANNFDFSSIGENTQYAIQGLPNYTNQKVVPLSVKAPETGFLTISIADIDTFFNSQDIFIIDYDLGITHNLKESNYTFNITTIGEHNNRFEIVFTNNALSTIDEIADFDKLIVTNQTPTSFLVKMKNGSIIKEFIAYDILGKIIFKQNRSDSSFNVQSNNIKTGTVLFIKVKLENGKILNTKFVF